MKHAGTRCGSVLTARSSSNSTGRQVTSDAGLLPYRELDEAAGVDRIRWSPSCSTSAPASNIRHSMTALLRQSVYSRLAGYEDTNDAERLSVDPAMRHVVGGRADGPAGRLHQPDGPLRDRGARAAREPRRPDGPVRADGSTGCASAKPDARSSSSTWTVRSARPTASRKARRTTVTSAAPATTRCSASTSSATWSGRCCATATSPAPTTGGRCWSRWSPATASWTSAGSSGAMRPSPPEIVRVPGRRGLPVRDPPAGQRGAAARDRAPADAAGGPAVEQAASVCYHDFLYQAGSWDQAAPGGGEDRVAPGRAVPARRLHRDEPAAEAAGGWSKFYNGRGTAEQWIKEGKNAVKWTRLSLPRLRGQPGAAATVRPGLQPGQLPDLVDDSVDELDAGDDVRDELVTVELAPASSRPTRRA